MKKLIAIKPVVPYILLVISVIILFWFLDDKGRDWSYENLSTKCLVQPFATIHASMPKEQYREDFSHLSYKFPSWWKPQLSRAKTEYLLDNHYIINRIVVAGKDIWYTRFSEGLIARYDNLTKEEKTYSILNNEGKPYDVADLYITKNGTLWVTLNSSYLDGEYSALARYSSEQDDFEVIDDQDGVFKLAQEDRMLGVGEKRLGELPDGRLVAILGGDIYLYNPVTKLGNLLVDSGHIVTIAIEKNDHIWFTNNYIDYHLREVDVRTGNVSEYNRPHPLKNQIGTADELLAAMKPIDIDGQGRVWSSYFGRLEPNVNKQYSWHAMDLPPIFVNTFHPYYAYRWAEVFSTQVFSDGNVWFASDIGIVKYDVKNKSWCLSAVVKTLSGYPITEDAEGNIWTAVDGQIYKFTP
ncbi:MAG: hypothetical protein HY869_20615 [Chloroflexi bacterium]|nr:hypothetical protein [Chloroflexota bacterium]